MNIGWGLYLTVFVCTVIAALIWHFRKKVPGIDDAGGYGSVGVYGAPLYAVMGVAMLVLFGLDCFFFLLGPQLGILAVVHTVLIVVTVASTVRWHYGSWRFGNPEKHRRSDAVTFAWLGVSVVGGIGILVTGLMCMLDHGATG